MRAALFALLMVTIQVGALRAAEIDRPFGIEKGTAIRSLDHLAPDKNFYLLRSVPKPHPLLSQYSAVASEKAGVCKVTGYITASDHNRIEDSLKILRKQISEVLGQPTFVPMTMDPGERGVWFWLSDAPPGARRSPLKMVSLHRLQGADRREAAMLQFTFVNEEDCAPPSGPNPFR